MLDPGAHQELLRVYSRQRGHAVHLDLSGEIDVATTPDLEQWLVEADGRRESTTIVVDLENVTFMDAGGLRAFLRAAERAGRSGRSFQMIKASSIVRKVLQITHTTHLLDLIAGVDGRPSPASDRRRADVAP